MADHWYKLWYAGFTEKVNTASKAYHAWQLAEHAHNRSSSPENSEEWRLRAWELHGCWNRTLADLATWAQTHPWPDTDARIDDSNPQT